MTTDELIWKKIKFALIFILSASILYILVNSIFSGFPLSKSVDMMKSISESEKILNEQKTYVTKVNDIKLGIDSLDFAISQVQIMDEIKENIQQLQNIYRLNGMSSKYIFGLQSSKTLKLYFDTKEELSSIIRNNEIIQKDLNECKANL